MIKVSAQWESFPFKVLRSYQEIAAKIVPKKKKCLNTDFNVKTTR